MNARAMATGRPEDVLKCIGHFGFGGGWAMASRSAFHGADGSMYCNSCPLSRPCWDAHKERVRELVPAMVEEFDRLLSKHLNDGQAAVKEMFDVHSTADPYSLVMVGNIEDGAAVGAGGNPKDRGKFTLQYPFAEGET